jgi:aminoglycoside phosphotransferase (APT) family kinase protein
MSILSSAKTRATALEAAQFQTWLRERDPSLADAVVVKLAASAGGAGFSNETLFATVTRGVGSPLEYVLRFGPDDPEEGLFPDYDIPKQYHVMRGLAARSDVPTPVCLWLETDPTIFGSPFFVMEKADGQVPSDDPPFTTQGFVFEASEADRERLWWSMIEAIARVGQVDWRAAGLSFLQPPPSAPSPIVHQLDYYERIYRWGRQGSAEFPLMERAIEWLRANAPSDGPTGLLWGDAKFSNVIVHDFRPVCLLDWELASLGDPECDLAYFLGKQLLMENHFIRPELSRPRLAGFPSDQETIRRYEALTGRKVRHFEYYTTFNFFKTMAMIQRAMDLLVRAKWITREDAEARKMSGGLMAHAIQQVVGR